MEYIQRFAKTRKPVENNGAAEKNRTSDPVITNEMLFEEFFFVLQWITRGGL